MAYGQVVPQKPIVWNTGGAGAQPPTTMFGDPRWWGDYELASDVLLEDGGAVELVGRIAAQRGQAVAGYHLRVGTDGRWRLYSQELGSSRKEDVDLAAGEASLDAGRWHRVALRMTGDQIEALLDGRSLGKVSDDKHRAGNAALRAEDWRPTQFDDVSVTPTAPAPAFLPQEKMTVVATSEHDRFVRGDVFKANYAIDGRPESLWHSAFDPRAPLPQSLTLDLGEGHTVAALAYQPRIDSETGGMITRYRVFVSDDGKSFDQVADGHWPVSTAVKTVSWPARQGRFVRLEAVEAANGVASAGDINVSETPIEPDDGR